VLAAQSHPSQSAVSVSEWTDGQTRPTVKGRGRGHQLFAACEFEFCSNCFVFLFVFDSLMRKLRLALNL
jgi:hypothetical protein